MRCAEVVNEIAQSLRREDSSHSRSGPPSADSENLVIPVYGPMQRRSAGFRYRAFKLLARPSKAHRREGRALLAQAAAAEAACGDGSPAADARYNRRWERLKDLDSLMALHLPSPKETKNMHLI